MSCRGGGGGSSSNSSSPCCSTANLSNACYTKVEPIRLSQDWTIENFTPLLKLCKPGHCLRSHVFKHSSLTDATWQLCLYPAGKRAENQGFVSLFLKMSSAVPNREILVTAEYKFHFFDDDRQVKFTNVNVGDFHAKPPKCGHSWGLRNIPRQRVLSALRGDGSLLVHCEIEFLPDPCRLRSHVVRTTAVNDKDLVPIARTYVDNMLSMFNAGLVTDCRVLVQDEADEESRYDDESTTLLALDDDRALNNNQNSDSRTSFDATTSSSRHNNNNSFKPAVFNVHKCMLSAHSEVFRAMFANDTLLESTNNTVVISDFTADTVQAMLEYVYSGGCGDGFADRAVDLLALAEKYSFSHLKSMCEDLLSTRICKETVCQTCASADLHRAGVLKRACLTYFALNCRDLLRSNRHDSYASSTSASCSSGIVRRNVVVSSSNDWPEWLELKDRNAKLAIEILEFVFRSATCNDSLELPPPEKRSKFINNTGNNESRSSLRHL